MFDLWYAVGTGIMFPKIVTPALVTQAASCFVNVPQHVAPKDPRALVPAWVPATMAAGYDLPGGGYVNEDDIADFRQAVADAVKGTLTRTSDFPPAVSLYTAAVLSQWISGAMFKYKAKLDQANVAFTDAAGTDPRVFSSGFRALLGVIFIDPELPATFADVNSIAVANNVADEFHIHPGERPVINSFAKAVQPGAPLAPAAGAAAVGAPRLAPALIDTADAGVWQQCPPTLLPWSGHTIGILN